MCSKDYIYMPIFACQLFYYMWLLHHTSASSYYHVRLVFLNIFQCPYIAEKSCLCIFSDGTSIIEHHVCFIDFICLFIAHICEHSLDIFTVVLVHLTAESHYYKLLALICPYKFIVIYIFNQINIIFLI